MSYSDFFLYYTNRRESSCLFQLLMNTLKAPHTVLCKIFINAYTINGYCHN